MSYIPTVRPSIAGVPAEARKEIDIFDTSVSRFLAGQVPENVFLEYRLRHGVYGQRQDGVHMMRSKNPLGIMSPEQMEAFADVSEAYAHGVVHLTTRQDIQVHFIPLTKTPDLMRVLADAHMTSREACGNVVRNITASVVSGVSPTGAFDVTPYGMALARKLLCHPDGQSLGRKFKITFADSFDPRFNQSIYHDVGATAVTREVDGNIQRGFHVLVGGGLGAVPHEAQVFSEFLPVEELLPAVLAMLRVFAVHGEKKNRGRARMKFIVAKWGIEKFRDAVIEEMKAHPDDPKLTGFDLNTWDDFPVHGPGASFPEGRNKDETRWLRTNLIRQADSGYAVVKVRVPRGDLSPDQLRKLAALLRKEVGDTTRIGPDQALYIRWVSWDRLLALREGLEAIGLGGAHAGGIADPVTCPGADTCKLGITSPRSVARQIQERLDGMTEDPRVENLRIHISGCPNSCATHQIADIGFFGAARKKDGMTAPYFVLMLGGYEGGVSPDGSLGGGFASAAVKVPAYRMADVVERLVDAYLTQSNPEDSFSAFANQLTRAEYKELLGDLTELPSYEEAPEYYREHGSEEDFTVRRGVGECAGEIVHLSDLLMADADREADQAHDIMESNGDIAIVRDHARTAMIKAALALLATEGMTNPDEFDVLEAFKTQFYETGRIFEGVGHYFIEALSESPDAVQGDRLRRLVTETVLFVEEAHTILSKMGTAPAMAAAGN